jgi:hypothetical protein
MVVDGTNCLFPVVFEAAKEEEIQAWLGDTTGDELMQGACCRVIDIGGSFESTMLCMFYSRNTNEHCFFVYCSSCVCQGVCRVICLWIDIACLNET